MTNTIPFPPKNDDQVPDNDSETQDSPVEDRHYSSDEVSAIIRLSLQQESRSPSGAVDYDDLVSIGKDMGVNAEQIDGAIKLLAEEQRAQAKEDELWLKFKAHCFVSTSIIVLCLLINLLTGLGSFDDFWAGYPLVALGFFMLGHYAGIRYAPEFVRLATEHTMNMANSKAEEFYAQDANVTFSISDDMGLSESTGMLYVEDDSLMVEYQHNDSILGIWKSAIREIDIPLSEIKLARMEQKFWNSELVLQGKSLKTFGGFPGNESGSIKITVNRQSQKAAESLIREIKSKM
ncbi:MAG: hypothetical protein GKR91_08690 [Pseudomonadales bacterium]|nr:hypothetical protein [Pseudomonadales bacterium]